MIKRVTYECELCNTHYNTAEEAETCEALHIPLVMDDIKAQYRQNDEYPYRLIVGFESGKRIVFDLKTYLKDD